MHDALICCTGEPQPQRILAHPNMEATHRSEGVPLEDRDFFRASSAFRKSHPEAQHRYAGRPS